MRTHAAIELQDVGKRYIQTVERPMLVRSLLGLERRHRQELWALRGVTVACERGSTLGVIGRNGSGKTTLLRLLAGVSAPSEGRLRIEGRIAPLIGVGVGFNAELTGRENVTVNGQLLGLTEREVQDRYDAIVDFAELADFIDTPVKFYSSGMFLRLAFAVAIHTEPDVFLIDEVLAVGDAAFQIKCLDRLRQAQDGGTTIVLVTHNLALLQQVAPRALVLQSGQVAFDGDAEAALAAYQTILQQEQGEQAADAAALLSGKAGGVIGGAQVSVELLDEYGRPATTFDTGDTIVARITADFGRLVDRPRLGLQVSTVDRAGIFTVNTNEGDYVASHGPGEPLHAEVRLTNRLLARTYLIHAAVYERGGGSVVGTSPPQPFVVRPGQRLAGLVDLSPSITMSGQHVEVRQIERLADGPRSDLPAG